MNRDDQYLFDILDSAKIALSYAAGKTQVVVHEYDAIDLNVLWDTVQNNIPDLVQAIEDMDLFNK